MHLDPSGLHIGEYKGCIALLGPALVSACAQASASGTIATDDSPDTLHVTLVTARERKTHLRDVPVPDACTIPVSNVYVVGNDVEVRRHGRSVRFLVVVWNHADVWRRKHGLGKKEYHITLSEDNDHEIPKGLGALVNAGQGRALLKQLAGLGETALDHAAVAADNVILKQQIAERMVVDYPDSYKAWARLAEATLTPKISALAYARAAALNPALLPRAVSQLKKMRDTVSYGPVGAELVPLPPQLWERALRPWPAELGAALSHMLWTAPTTSRAGQLNGWYHLPRFFSWLYPSRVAGMSTPRRAADIDVLARMGFTHVLSLTEEEPLDEDWFRFVVQHVYVPVPNYHPPTIAEMDAIWAQVAAGGVWLVHCGGGVGRAGTVLACLIAMMGTGDDGPGDVPVASTPRLDARSAISLLRHARPRSLETEHQERFVAEWVSHRWKVAHAADTTTPEPVTLLQVDHPSHDPITALFLIGRPGSGKSWLASALAKRRGPKKTLIISQDESGSRAFCEMQLGRISNLPPDTLVILDRCNPSRADRKRWLDLIGGARRCVAVYFDFPATLCKQRLDARLDHPTLRAGRGANALAQMDREMEAPDAADGWESIFTITSIDAARQAVRRITPDPPLLKFPRTPHLVNLGASTDDDIVLADFDELRGNLTIEEKIDGANMGFSLDYDGVVRVQNRSHWVSSADHAQFKPLDKWVRAHDTALRRILGSDPQYPERFILYGEWAVARHSVHYTSLPGPFLAFDLYDRVAARFLSRSALTRVLAGSGIPQVPLITKTRYVTRAEVLDMVQETSAFTDGKREGVYVRTEDDSRRYTISRGKVVRGDFIAGNEHWARGPLVLNGFARE